MSDAFGTSTPTSITVVATSTSISPRTNAAIVAAFSSGFMRPCIRPTRSAGSAAVELRVQRDGGLQLELFRFLDQRAHPVRLPAFARTACRPTRRSRCRRFWLTRRVATGVRPGGISSIAETSRSA